MHAGQKGNFMPVDECRGTATSCSEKRKVSRGSGAVRVHCGAAAKPERRGSRAASALPALLVVRALRRGWSWALRKPYAYLQSSYDYVSRLDLSGRELRNDTPCARELVALRRDR